MIKIIQYFKDMIIEKIDDLEFEKAVINTWLKEYRCFKGTYKFQKMEFRLALVELGIAVLRCFIK